MGTIWRYLRYILWTSLMGNLMEKIFFVDCWSIKIIMFMELRIAEENHGNICFSF